ncbi:hypothetical protein Glove_88g1 [Diversispora epigaea]|uniref:Uncharacterized protein n=1 Tax=Diversispora epigaea TaxID=1348612 RepID=A0A397JCP9_9GLOM|nr:hypothetical protein Glove_88g1 [Diversispora epigaea]
MENNIIVQLSSEISVQVSIPTLAQITQNKLDSILNVPDNYIHNGGFLLFFNTLQSLIYANPEIPNRHANLALAAVIAWKRSSNEYRLEFSRLAREAGIDN